MKKENLKYEELIKELCDINSDQININTLEFYKTKYEITLSKIKHHTDSEPSKLFKKSHFKWEKELNELNRELDDTYNQIKNIF